MRKFQVSFFERKKKGLTWAVKKTTKLSLKIVGNLLEASKIVHKWNGHLDFFFISGFPNKNGKQQMPYMYDILTESILVAP